MVSNYFIQVDINTNLKIISAEREITFLMKIKMEEWKLGKGGILPIF